MYSNSELSYKVLGAHLARVRVDFLEKDFYNSRITAFAAIQAPQSVSGRCGRCGTVRAARAVRGCGAVR